MERKVITDSMLGKLREPLPNEAIKQHPTKKYLSTINSIYVTERLNDVFGIGTWTIKSEFISKENKMVIVKTTLEIEDYGIHYECYGGNDNADTGDAYKGAVTDAITKIGSWMGIGAHVWKNDPYGAKEQSQPANKERAAREYLMSNDKAREYYCDKARVGSIDELDLSKVYEHLKSINKI